MSNHEPPPAKVVTPLITPRPVVAPRPVQNKNETEKEAVDAEADGAKRSRSPSLPFKEAAVVARLRFSVATDRSTSRTLSDTADAAGPRRADCFRSESESTIGDAENKVAAPKVQESKQDQPETPQAAVPAGHTHHHKVATERHTEHAIQTVKQVKAYGTGKVAPALLANGGELSVNGNGQKSMYPPPGGYCGNLPSGHNIAVDKGLQKLHPQHNTNKTNPLEKRRVDQNDNGNKGCNTVGAVEAPRHQEKKKCARLAPVNVDSMQSRDRGGHHLAKSKPAPLIPNNEAEKNKDTIGGKPNLPTKRQHEQGNESGPRKRMLSGAPEQVKKAIGNHYNPKPLLGQVQVLSSQAIPEPPSAGTTAPQRGFIKTANGWHHSTPRNISSDRPTGLAQVSLGGLPSARVRIPSQMHLQEQIAASNKRASAARKAERKSTMEQRAIAREKLDNMEAERAKLARRGGGAKW